MQDTVLRLFVVAVAVIMYPREHPEVQEQEDIITTGMQEHEERLLREAGKLDQEMTAIDKEVVHDILTEKAQDDIESNHEVSRDSQFYNESDQELDKTDNIPLVEDLIATLPDQEHSGEGNKQDPGVQDHQDDTLTTGMQLDEEKLLTKEEKLDQEMAAIDKKVVHDILTETVPDQEHFGEGNKEDPGVQEQQDVITTGLQKDEERLLTEGEKLDQEMTAIDREIVHDLFTEKAQDIESNHKEPHEPKFYKESDQDLDKTNNIPLVNLPIQEYSGEGGKEDPGVQEEEDVITTGLQQDEERLLTEGEKLDQEMTAIDQETVHDLFTEKAQDDIESNHEEPHESQLYSESDQDVDNSDSIPVVLNMTLPDQEHSKKGDNVDETLLKVDHHTSDLSLNLSQVEQENVVSDPQPLHIDQELDQSILVENDQLKLDKDDPSSIDQQSENVKFYYTLSDAGILTRQQELLEKDEVFHRNEEVSQSLPITEPPMKDNPENSVNPWVQDFLSYLCNTYSVFAMIRFFRKFLKRNSQSKLVTWNNISGELQLPDSDTLLRFYDKCVNISPDDTWGTGEFLEGFASDLLEAMMSIKDGDSSMALEDFQVVENASIIVPFVPLEPYSFQCHLWSNQAGDTPPAMQAGGNIKMMKTIKNQNGCDCTSADPGDDILCLVHTGENKVKRENIDGVNGPLCMKNTPFLSKSQVTKWFQSTIRQAWSQISHKYEFELIFRNSAVPGALTVRFRSGKRINFNMKPVVKFNETDGYFFISPCLTSNSSDTFWTLSLSIYEDRFLKHLSKALPENSCHIQALEILYFFHRKQTMLTGRSALKDVHFKTTVMNLLLAKDPSAWCSEHIAQRIKDLLTSMQKSLQLRQLHHILFGNALVGNDIELPAAFSQAEPVNLFHPLVVDNSLYIETVKHFKEILKNAHVLIEEYAK